MDQFALYLFVYMCRLFHDRRIGDTSGFFVCSYGSKTKKKPRRFTST